MKTGLLYNEAFARHLTGIGHPERPERVLEVYDFLRGQNDFEKFSLLSPEPAPLSIIQAIHSERYCDYVKKGCGEGVPFLDSPDTGVSADSYETALLAAGSGPVLVDMVMAGEIVNGFGLIRPPGHHAEREQALGFCLFNNIAILARYIREKYELKKVLIIDWDVHHGNGTQNTFYNDPEVFYFSVHESPCYPGTGLASERGEGDGEGATLNVPLPAGSTDDDYRRVFEDLLCPNADCFQPDFVLVSAGFDAHVSDPLAGMRVSESGYRMMTRIVKDIAMKHASGRLVSLLEGGYDLEALKASVLIHLQTLRED